MNIVQASLVPVRRDKQQDISGSSSVSSGAAIIVGGSGGGGSYDDSTLYLYIDGSLYTRDSSIIYLFQNKTSFPYVDGSLALRDASITDLYNKKVNRAGDTMTGPLIINTAGTISLQLNSSSNSAFTNYGGISSANYVSQLTGYRISYSGDADFRYLYTDELHAKAFIADLEQALAGLQIITKSVAKISIDFIVPTAGNTSSLVVEELAGFTGQVFADGDIIQLRQFTRVSGGLTIANIWGTVVYVSRDPAAIPTTQTYTFTRSNAPNSGTGSGTVTKGTLALDYGVSGQGYYEVNAIDGTNGVNAPYMRIVTWTGHPATGSVLKFQSGNLNNITDSDFGGALSGWGVYSNNAYFKGKVVITGGSGYANFTDKPTIPTNTNQLTDGANLGATANWSSISGLPSPLVAPGSTPGLYLTSTYLGYWNGSAWVNFMDNAGNAGFTGVTTIGTQAGGSGSNCTIMASSLNDTASTSDSGAIYINNVGYQGGNSYFRDFIVADGKNWPNGILIYCDGSQDRIGIRCNSVSDIDSMFRVMTRNGAGLKIGYNDGATNFIYGALTSDNTITATNFIGSSDERLKTKIEPLRFSHIPIKFKTFELKSEPGVKRTGVIAQELEKTNPEFVRKDENGMLSVASIDLLFAKVAELEARIKELETR